MTTIAHLPIKPSKGSKESSITTARKVVTHITSRQVDALKPVDFPEIDEIVLKNNFRLSVQRISGLYISRVLDENDTLIAFASCPTICQSVTVAVRKVERELTVKAFA